MAKPKGSPKVGGRVAGTPNKATVEFRETVTKLLSDNASNVALPDGAVARTVPVEAGFKNIAFVTLSRQDFICM